MLARRVRWRLLLGQAAVFAAVLLLIAYPLALLAFQSVYGSGRLDLGSYGRLVEGQTGLALIHTLSASIAASSLALAFGAPMALFAQRSDLPARKVFGFLLFLPLLIPPFVSAVSWLQAYARGGLTSHWLGFWVDWLQGPGGVIGLLALQSYPLVYLLTSAGLAAQVGTELEEAARISGANQWRCCLSVTLPRLAPAVLAGGLLAFVSAASDFGIPAVLGIPAGYSVVTTLIYRALSLTGSPGALADAVALSALLALLAVAAVVAAVGLSRAATPSAGLSRRGGAAVSLRLGRWRWAVAAVIAIFVGAAVLLPLLALALSSVEPGFVPVLMPTEWTLRHFEDAFANGGLEALLHSAGLAVGAGVTVAVGGAAVAAVSRTAGRLAHALESLTVIPFALPGSVVAVAAILAWQHWLYGTLRIILLAYVIRFAAFGVRSARAAMAQVPDEHRQAARLAGARPWQVAILVERPFIQPALLAAFALTFVLAIHELTISSLLYTPQTETLAVQVLDSQQAGDVSVTAALAVVVLAVTLTAALPLLLSSRIRRLLGVELVA